MFHHRYNLTGIQVSKGINIEELVRGVQPIAFDNAVWAYLLGAAIAIQKASANVQEIALSIGEGLQAFTVPGSVAEQREVGLGHGRLASMLLDEKTRTFAFVAGHESFAAAEGGIRNHKICGSSAEAAVKSNS